MKKSKVAITILLLISSVFVVAYTPTIRASEFKLSWATKSSMPTPRAQSATVAGNDGKIYVAGGYNSTNILNTTEVYNPSTNSWSTKAQMPEAVRAAAAARGLDGLIYVISGYNETGDWTPTVQAYNPDSGIWTKKADIPYPVLFSGAAVGNDGRIYVVGGTEPGASTDRLQIYDPHTDTWGLGASLPSSQTQLGVISDRNGFIYAIGGQTFPVTPGALSDVEVYDPSSNTWSARTSMIDGRNEFGTALAADGNVYVIGGGKEYTNNNPPFFGTVTVYDPLANSWSFDANMPTPRKELGAVAVGDRIYAIGGCNGTYLGTVEEAKLAMPNMAPTAYIDSVSPNPVTVGEQIFFVGHGTDTDGSVVAYNWRSSLNGTISTSATFNTSELVNGTHTIYLSVKDDSGAWSPEVTAVVTVNTPLTEDPLYQKTLDLDSRLSDLQQRNSNLTDEVNGLTTKLDTMAWELMAASAVAIILAVAILSVLLIRRRKPPPTA